MRKKISDFLKKTMIFEIATASLCAVVIIVLFYKGIDVDKGRFKIVYDVSINVMAASGLAFLIELISAKLNLAESIEDERKVLIRHHMFIKHLIAKYVASYIDLTTADYSYATDLLSKCDFKKCDGVKGMRQNFPPEELSRMFGHSILVADGMFMSPIAKWVDRKSVVWERV